MGGLEDANLSLAFEVEKAHERGGLADAEVVASEEAEPAASSQQVAEMGLDAVEAARHDEADGDVCSGRQGQLSAQVREEGVVLASRHETRGRGRPLCADIGAGFFDSAGAGVRGEVVGFAGDDVADAAAGVGDVRRR
jgi:hypothetical protein